MKYINLKYLIETVDDEDFFSDLGYDTEKEITFLVDDKLYPDNVKILGTNPILKDIENIDHIGAILSNDNGYWLLWNLNNEYWYPFNEDNSILTEDFGLIVGICVGKGLFAKVSWSGLTNRYKWANEDDPIYKTIHKINIDGSGYESSMNIINNYSEYIQGSIWEHLVKESTNEYLLYLPNIKELKTIYNNVGDWETFENTNIYKVLTLTASLYWSSSLYADSNSDYIKAYFIFFDNDYTDSDYKTSTYRSVALIHF